MSFLLVPKAVANPFCHIPLVCEIGTAIDFATDPFGFILQKIGEANIWFLKELLDMIQNTSKINLGGSEFTKHYAIIFAASGLITVALWLIGVAKRAVRGVALGTALGEAVGFLLLSVVVSALAPAVVGLFLAGVDEVTKVFQPYAVENFKPFLEALLKHIAVDPGNGNAQLLVVNLVMLLGGLLMWVEMLIRGAAIYVAVALAPMVTAGLVDKDLWPKTRKWVGAVVGLALTKPVLVALLGLGGAVLSDSATSKDPASQILVGALILLLTVFASASVYKWVPTFGDDMAALHHARKSAASSGPAGAVPGPASTANSLATSYMQKAVVGGGKAASTGAKAAATGPGAAAVAAAKAAKAGVDWSKNKAMSSPGASPDTSGQGGASKGGGTPNAGGAPATTRPPASAPSAASPRAGSSPSGSRPTPPATAKPAVPGGSGAVVSAPGGSAKPPAGAPPTPPATARTGAGATSTVVLPTPGGPSPSSGSGSAPTSAGPSPLGPAAQRPAPTTAPPASSRPSATPPTSSSKDS
ncbi:hypothetical protein ACN20G_11775 [Streptomyces sp. BI20]|uniref:hypothetical protein n=1 Tax=Streptomyces sp. BI20 TaxID=3403460 RepID=UPI003C73C7FD